MGDPDLEKWPISMQRYYPNDYNYQSRKPVNFNPHRNVMNEEHYTPTPYATHRRKTNYSKVIELLCLLLFWGFALLSFDYNSGLVYINSCLLYFYLHLRNISTDLSSKSPSWVSLTLNPPLPKPLDGKRQKAISWPRPLPVWNGKGILKYLEPSALSPCQHSISGFWSSEAMLAESPQRSHSKGDTPRCANTLLSYFLGSVPGNPLWDSARYWARPKDSGPLGNKYAANGNRGTDPGDQPYCSGVCQGLHQPKSTCVCR